MNEKTVRILRFLPLVLYLVAAVWLLVAFRSFHSYLSTVLITMPMALGVPLATIFIGAKPRCKNTYVIGAVVGALGVLAVAGLAAAFSLLWISMRMPSGDVEVMEVIMAFFLLVMSGIETTWPMMISSFAASVWMVVCTATVKTPAEESTEVKN